MTNENKKAVLKLTDIILIIIVVIALGIIFLGCVEESGGDKEKGTVETACIQLCQQALDRGVDLSNGPCLSDKVQVDWVCDVAHSPRQDVDNDPANQCPAYGDTAHHFVEVTPNCEFIKAV